LIHNENVLYIFTLGEQISGKRKKNTNAPICHRGKQGFKGILRGEILPQGTN